MKLVGQALFKNFTSFFSLVLHFWSSTDCPINIKWISKSLYSRTGSSKTIWVKFCSTNISSAFFSVTISFSSILFREFPTTSVDAKTQQVFPGYMGKSNNLSPKFACCVFLSGGDFFLQNTINQSPNANSVAFKKTSTGKQNVIWQNIGSTVHCKCFAHLTGIFFVIKFLYWWFAVSVLSRNQICCTVNRKFSVGSFRWLAIICPVLDCSSKLEAICRLWVKIGVSCSSSMS